MSWRYILPSARRFERLALKAIRHQSVFAVLNRAEQRQLGKLNRSPALSDLIEALRDWCARPPKGFEKFFKEKPGVKSEPKPAEAAKVGRQKSLSYQSYIPPPATTASNLGDVLFSRECFTNESHDPQFYLSESPSKLFFCKYRIRGH
jgi:hypothetical protein